MPRRPVRLSNLYLPLPLPRDEDDEERGSIDGSTKNRADGRELSELRRLCLESNVVSCALGSSLIELGHTKVISEVHIAAALVGNPNKSSGSGSLNNEASNDTGCLKVNVKYAPFIGVDQITQLSRSVSDLDDIKKAATSNSFSSQQNVRNIYPNSTKQPMMTMNQTSIQRENELSKKLTAALLPVIILEQYPKCAVVVNVMVLQDDGSCLSAAITASSIALVDARVDLRDLVTSCTVAVVEKTNICSNNNDDVEMNDDQHNDDERWIYLADPTEREELANNVALICLAMTPNQKEVTLWNQSGRLSSDMVSRAIELCQNGCRTMHKFMRESLIKSVGSTLNEV